MIARAPESGAEQPLVEPELRADPQDSGRTEGPHLRLVRNHLDDGGEFDGVAPSLLRRSRDLVDTCEGVGTVAPMSGEPLNSSPPSITARGPDQVHGSSLLRRLSERPKRGQRVVTKQISKVSVEVVIPRAADPAVLSELTPDRRLRLKRLVTPGTVLVLAPRYEVESLATGCVDLAPAGDETDEGSPCSTSRSLVATTDDQCRLYLSRGLVHRLAVPAGGKVLVTWDPPTGRLRLVSLATLADVLDRITASEAPS